VLFVVYANSGGVCICVGGMASVVLGWGYVLLTL